MKRFRLGLVMTASAAAGLLASASALAGFKTAQQVSISDTGQFANGDLGYVRNTSDTTQYMGCQVWGGSGYCFAQNSAGVYRSCSTSDPLWLSSMQAVNGDSYLIFYWNSSGQCTFVEVANGSFTAPKGP